MWPSVIRTREIGILITAKIVYTQQTVPSHSYSEGDEKASSGESMCGSHTCVSYLAVTRGGGKSTQN